MIYFIGNHVELEGVENATIEDLVNYLTGIEETGFDTETTGFDPYVDKILSYQFGDGLDQYVVDAVQYPIEILKDILEGTGLELIIQNAKFDLKFLYDHGIYPPKVWDTYLAEAKLHQGDRSFKKSLEAIVERYYGFSLTKTIRGKIVREGFSERVIHYCAEDVQFLPGIKASQIKQLKAKDLIDAMSLENLFVKVLTYIEYSGIYLDVDRWKSKIVQGNIDFINSLKNLNDWIIDNKLERYIDRQLDLFSTDIKTTINWSSPQQMVAFFQSLGVDTKVPDEKTGQLKDSVDAGVLKKQIDKSSIIPLYIEYKENEKILSTYGESVLDKIHAVTGRIHSQFNQIMDTGRMSSGGKMGNKKTINLQNIPRMPDKADRVVDKIYERECFTAQSGNVLVNADYSGQEQVIFANWTLDKDLLAFYDKKLGDMHSFIASKIFPYLKDVPLNVIKDEYKRERQIAKSAGFAINYGGDADTIASNLNISKEEGEEIYKGYFAAFPGVSDYFRKVADQVLRDGYILFNDISRSKCFLNNFDDYKNVEKKVIQPGFWELYKIEKERDSTLFKRTLKPTVSKYFRLKANISKMAYNYPIQGSAAEVTKLACIYIFDYICSHSLQTIVKFSNVVHDEILLECPKEMYEGIMTMVKGCMDRAGDVYCKVVPLKADVKVCEYWDH